ncbi:DUF1576 domain-containing protein [Orenia marismortui]|uniref:DUF1576 domain-containing protein n=1 Tax=Orenia marismortui TaxID=46469 RepID=UPI00035DB5C9|nr:DUF1576 domain-containing protein [Orenia marismortui]
MNIIKIEFTKKRISEDLKFRLLLIYPISLILIAFILDNPQNITQGLKNIILSSDLLITDYLGIGGLSATLLNSGILGLTSLLLLKSKKVRLTGISIAAIFTVMGFSMFGKNLLNVIPIILGVKLYSIYQKEPLRKFLIIALFSTALAPLVSQTIFILGFTVKGLFLATFIGVVTGFITPPLASHLLSSHQGFNLYNLGFTAGLIGTLLMSLFRSYGIEYNQNLIWTTKYTGVLGIILTFHFLSLILVGYLLNNQSFRRLKKLWKRSGRIVTDFVTLDTFPVTIINMGLMGLFYTLLLFLIGSPLNGPTVGGLFTIVGFSAFGKHPFNTFPIIVGVLIGSVTKIWGINNPGLILALLFSTTLAPISGVFGRLSGVIAGFLHLSVVMNIGYLHGGLNLYNNGFAGGLVAIILFPILDSIKKE